MPVGIHASSRDRESCSKRGERGAEVGIVSDSDKRQTKILRASNARVQADRAGIEAAVFGKETFVETVVTKTSLVDLLREYDFHVRKRKQVDRSRGDGVEAGQHVARKYRERKRLIAVAVVVAAGDLIALVERMIDLRDEAVYIV